MQHAGSGEVGHAVMVYTQVVGRRPDSVDDGIVRVQTTQRNTDSGKGVRGR
jgi:hypothetical protein